MACGKCGGPLAQDPSAADEYSCRSCGARLYATKPNTGGKTANPLSCPGCGVRVYQGWQQGVSALCGDCRDARFVAGIQTPSIDRRRQIAGQASRAELRR